MLGQVSIINNEAFKKCLEQLKKNPGTAVPFSAQHFGLPPFEMKPLPGFKFPDNFPVCCANHIQLMEIANDYYALFPNCCEEHKKLLTCNWFNKENFKYLPHKIVNALLYSTHAVEQLINGPNWLKDITDYLDGTVLSFGQLPEGYGARPGLSLFINNMILRINSLEIVSNEKREKIQLYIQKNYLESSKHSSTTNSSITDFNILLTTYRKWLKIFPFDIVPFSAIKKDFTNRLPIISGCIEVNKFTQTATASLANQQQLLEFLIETTRLILDSVDTPAALSKGQITDLDKFNFERLSASHRLAQTALLGKHTKGELKYISILKKWLSNEKEYLSQIKLFNLPDTRLKPTNNTMHFGISSNKQPSLDFKSQAIQLAMKSPRYIQSLNFQLNAAVPVAKPTFQTLADLVDLNIVKDIYEIEYLFLKLFKPAEEFPENIYINDYQVTDLIYRLYIFWFENDYKKSPNKKALIENTLSRYRKEIDLSNQFAEMNNNLSNEPTRDTIRTGYKHFFQGKNPGLLERYKDFKKEVEDQSRYEDVSLLFTLDFIAMHEKSKHAIDNNLSPVQEDFKILSDYDDRVGFLVDLHLKPLYNLFQYCWGYALAKSVHFLEQLLSKEIALTTPKASDQIYLGKRDQDKVYQVARGYFLNPDDNDFYIWSPGRNQQFLSGSNGSAIVLNWNIMLLFNDELPLVDQERINVQEFTETYIDGYQTGIKWFEELYKTDAATFRNNSKEIVSDLKFAYYYQDPKSGENHKHWKSWLTKYFEAFKLSDIYELGFYAAAYVSLVNLTKIYPTAFKDFFITPDDYILVLTRKKEPAQSVSTKTAFESDEPNDFLRSTIIDYLEAAKNGFTTDSIFDAAVNRLWDYFMFSKQPTNQQHIFTKYGSAKKLAFAVGEIYRSQVSAPISLNFLKFIKGTFETFKDEDIDSLPITKTRLYKYCTGKPQ